MTVAKYMVKNQSFEEVRIRYLVPKTSAIESNDGGKYASAFERSNVASDIEANEDGSENAVAMLSFKEDEDEEREVDEDDWAAPFFPGNTVL
jgi:hypothetical protein